MRNALACRATRSRFDSYGRHHLGLGRVSDWTRKLPAKQSPARVAGSSPVLSANLSTFNASDGEQPAPRVGAPVLERQQRLPPLAPTCRLDARRKAVRHVASWAS